MNTDNKVCSSYSIKVLTVQYSRQKPYGKKLLQLRNIHTRQQVKIFQIIICVAMNHIECRLSKLETDNSNTAYRSYFSRAFFFFFPPSPFEFNIGVFLLYFLCKMLSPEILFEQADQHLEHLLTYFFGCVWIQIGSTKKGSENVHSYLKLMYVKRQPDDKILGSLYSSGARDWRQETEISNEKTSSE